jgi:hypothetical protein
MAFSYVWINTQQIRKLDLIMIHLEHQASSYFLRINLQKQGPIYVLIDFLQFLKN